MTLTNLAKDLATEASQTSILSALRTLASRANSAGDAVLVSGSKRKYRREFTDPTMAEWDQVVAASMTVTPTLATGNLVVTTGTTANALTTLTTKEAFTAPFKTAVGLRMSQKIANLAVFIELVAENDDGTLDETTVAAWRMSGSDSTTSTVARAEVQNGETSRSQSPNLTTQAHTAADAVFETTLESDEVWFTSKPMDSSAGRLTPYVRNSVCPDPNRRYRIRLRFLNGSTAPASSTTVTFYFVSAVDYTEQQVEVTGGNGSVGIAQAIPVQVLATPTGALSVSITGGNSTPQAGTTMNACNIAKVLSAASTNPTVIKNAANARLYGYQLANLTASWRYLRFYNRTTVPTVGTDSPTMVVPIPPNGMVDIHMTIPATFATGLAYAITGGVADLDAAAIGASDVVGHILWV